MYKYSKISYRMLNIQKYNRKKETLQLYHYMSEMMPEHIIGQSFTPYRQYFSHARRQYTFKLKTINQYNTTECAGFIRLLPGITTCTCIYLCQLQWICTCTYINTCDISNSGLPLPAQPIHVCNMYLICIQHFFTGISPITHSIECCILSV